MRPYLHIGLHWVQNVRFREPRLLMVWHHCMHQLLFPLQPSSDAAPSHTALAQGTASPKEGKARDQKIRGAGIGTDGESKGEELLITFVSTFHSFGHSFI